MRREPCIHLVLGAMSCLAMPGCDVVFGLDVPGDAAIDADPTAPRAFAPALFPEHAGAQAGPYLFEGTGYGFASVAQRMPGAHRPVPIAIDRLTTADTISIEIPPELGAGWEVCGLPASGGVDLAGQLAAPCARGDSIAAFTIVVPVSGAVGAAGTVSPLMVRVTRGAATFELPIAILPLDENIGVPTSPSGLFSAIDTSGFIAAPGGSPVAWQAVSDVEIRGVIDVRGRTGAGGPGCEAAGCAGGMAGAGNTSHGASSNCGETVCAAAGPLGGDAGAGCSTSTCVPGRFAVGGGGGGGATVGQPGRAGSACTSDASGGAARGGDEFLLDLATAGGGGGGAGAPAFESSGSARYGSGGAGGGGVVAIDALGAVRFLPTGEIDARGGAGGPSMGTTCNGYVRPGIGGGGGGGAIRIRAGEVTAPGSLDAVLRVAGGTGESTLGGRGGRGHVRVDALGASLTVEPGAVRGADFDPPPPISSTPSIAVVARAQATPGGMVHAGFRSAGAPSYFLTSTPGGGAAVSVALTLAPGLDEICVFAIPPDSADVAAIPDARKRCTWVAVVE